MGAHSIASEDALKSLTDAALVSALIHPRVAQQDFWTADESPESFLRQLAPQLRSFPGRDYESVRVVLDWDHRLPSRGLFLRIFASYTESAAATVARELERIQSRIEEDNLYPEFDVPDFGSIQADEVYVTGIDVRRHDEDLDFSIDTVRFYSDWRRHVEADTLDKVQKAVKQTEPYRRALNNRASEHFGDAILVGWTPPCAARSTHWALELWLVTNFEGRFGKARVFMVDTEDLTLSHSFDTDIQLAA